MRFRDFAFHLELDELNMYEQYGHAARASIACIFNGQNKKYVTQVTTNEILRNRKGFLVVNYLIVWTRFKWPAIYVRHSLTQANGLIYINKFKYEISRTIYFLI